MGEANEGSTWEPRDEIAVCSGEIASNDAVTFTHGSDNIASVVADHSGGTLVLNFKTAFDPDDNVYFAVAFIYAAGGNVQAMLPTAFTTLSVTLTGSPYPGSAPWTFAIFAITTPK